MTRIIRAQQQSLRKEHLPQSEWTKPEDDVPHLLPLIEMVENELAEKSKYQAVVHESEGGH